MNIGNHFKSRGILFFFIGIFLVFGLWGQHSGFKYFKNYTRKDYGSSPQNWWILQDKRGVIYVGNQNGLLEFDGVSWRSIDIPNKTARSLAVGDTGTVYVGGKDEFGFLAPTPNGSLKYESLLGHIEGAEKNVSLVRWTHSTKEGIYFITLDNIFRWDNRQLKIWDPDFPIYGSYCCKGELFIYLRNAGLMKMVKDNLELIPGGEAFATVRKIVMIVPYGPQKILIGTRPDGFFIYDGMKMTPFPIEVNTYLNEKMVYQGFRMSSGNLAMATLRGGLVIIDSDGRLKDVFTRDYGLLDDDVKFAFEDTQGNLWLSLNSGIAKIEYSSPVYTYDERVKLPGLVLSVVRHQGNLYSGTSQGLYFLDAAGRFQSVTGMPENCWALLSTDKSMLAATSYGVFQVENSNRRRITKSPSYVLHHSTKNTNRIWVGTLNGLVSLYLNKNQWVMEHTFDKISEEIRTVIEDRDGNLWLGALTKGVYKLDFLGDENSGNPVITGYSTGHGLPHGEIHVFMSADHPIFATEKGIYRFDEKNDGFIPDFTLGNEFADGTKNVFRFVETKNKNIWFHSKSRNFKAAQNSDGSFDLIPTPVLRVPPSQTNTIYPDGNTIWFANHDGLVRYDAVIEKKYHQDFPVLIRSVVVNGKLVFNGYRSNITSDPESAFGVPIFDYKDRNMRIAYAAPFFEGESLTRYQNFLDGYDSQWSEWTSETKKDYTNLDSGMYRFRVRAKNTFNDISREAVFKFKILPPWHKTWWAFSIYAITALMVVFLIVRWRSGKLEREKKRLERIVNERTKMINQKSRQLETQTSQLKEQSIKLQEMAKVKSRFFANISHEFRTPLTLIMGPLEHLLARDRDKEEEKQLNGMLRNSQRLLTLINQLLDLSRFDSGKMKLQAAQQDIVPFLKGIMASFQILTDQNKIKLELTIETKVITLYFDTEKMEEVISNLLANAVKFTPEGETITVSVKQIPGKAAGSPEGFLELSVSDTGVGIPKDQLGHIFDRFYKAERGTQNTKGTGIGLALAKELVNLHQGNIDVHSTEGKGTTFIIRLPMGKDHLKADEIVASPIPSNQKKSREISTLSVMVEEERENRKVELETDEKEMTPGAGEKDVILVVEDNAEVRKYIKDPLEPFYTVKEAANGKQGIEIAKKIIPDLIVSDIMMPEMDGYELCNILKKDVKTSHIPIVLLTAKASEESVIEGLETGADDYITKPFNSKILMTRIKNLIELRRQLQGKFQRQMLLQPEEISVSSVDREFIKEVLQVIEKNLSDPEFNVETLSKKLYMNRATLYRKIMALTGEPPTQFIRSYRLKRGAQLLRDKFGNVSEVALEVGFSNMAYFAKCFKEKFHQSPSTYQAAESH